MMTLRDHLATIVARDSRYAIEVYLFVFEALQHTKNMRKTNRIPRPSYLRKAHSSAGFKQHVSGRELCEGVCELAIRQYGPLSRLVLAQWGLHTTSDIGEIVYHLIDAGDLEVTPTDSRTDFDDVFDLAVALAIDNPDYQETIG